MDTIEDYDPENIPYDINLWHLRYKQLKDALRERVQSQQKKGRFINADEGLNIIVDFFKQDKVTRPGDLMRVSWDKLSIWASHNELSFYRRLKLWHWDDDDEYQLTLKLIYDTPVGNSKLSAKIEQDRYDEVTNDEIEAWQLKIRESRQFINIAQVRPVSVQFLEHWDFAGGG